ncbi:MAG: COG2426 family protein [Sphaerochaetaceae bacterium]
MSISNYLITVILALAPISELRGAIPYAYAQGIPLLEAALIGTLINIAVSPIAYLFLTFIHNIFYSRFNWYIRLFDRTVERTRERLHDKVHSYGWVGIMLFVAVPLPITGAWTGTLGAWIFGLEKRKSILAVSLGVIIAGIIVTLLLYVGVSATSIFIKRITI